MSISRLLFLGFGLLIAVLVGLSMVAYTQLKTVDTAVAATGRELTRIVEKREPLRRTGYEMEISSNELALAALEYFRNRRSGATTQINAAAETFAQNYADFKKLADEEERPAGFRVNNSFLELKKLTEESISHVDDQFEQLAAMSQKARTIENAVVQLQQTGVSDELTTEQVEQLRAALWMEIALHELRSAVHDYRMDREPANRQEVKNAVMMFEQFAGAFADADASPEDLQTLQGATAEFGELNELATRIMDLADTRDEHFSNLQQEIGAIHSALNDVVQPKIEEDVKTARRNSTRALDDAVRAVGTAGWVLLIATLVGIVVGGGAATVISQQITRPLATMVQAAEDLAEGDLTQPALAEGTNETGRLAVAFNQMVASLRTILGESKTISGEVASSSSEIATGAQQQLASLNQTAASLNQITTTAEEFKATMQEFADRARAVQEAADETTKQTAEGRTLTQEAASRIEQVRVNAETAGESVLNLAEQMQRIGEITATVNEIAEQTKLLALNASIEAARAGEEGRGFAVVATQVRELANQSKESAGRIEELITNTQRSMQDVARKTEEGSRLSKDSVQSVKQMAIAFEEIANAIDQTREAMSQINTGAKQQEEGIVELVSSITEIDSGSKESVAAAEQTEKAIVAIDQRIRSLNQSIARFKT